MIGLSEDLTLALSVTASVTAFAFIVFTVGDRHSTLSRAIVTGLCLVLMWRYMTWRLTQTLPPVDLTADFVVGITFASVEALSLLGSTLSMIFLIRTRDRTQDVEQNLSWLLDRPEHPRVDVLICTYNEDQTILERTIAGALWTTYPNARVWVCDDGGRPWLARLAEKHGCGYIVRPDNAHAKAGNINNAIKHLASLPEPPDYIAILDADFVTTPPFITRAMALFRDPTVGLVQTPQHFANPDPIQSNLSIAHAWPDEQRFFFEVIMPSKDAWGAAFCCGTSSIIRFDALMKIGGFPTTSVTEDYLVSLKLRAEGFQTVFLNERLSLGLAPEGLQEYITQRSRWCLGFVQICRSADGPWWPGNRLRLADRLILTETFLYWSAQHLVRLLGLIVPVLYLLFGIQAVNASLSDAVLYFLPFYVVMLSSMQWLTRGRVVAILSDVSQLLAVHEILKAVAIGLIWPKNQKFKVTAKGGDRSRRLVQWPVLRWFLGYLVLTLLGIGATFLVDSDRGSDTSSVVALFWSWYNILVLVMACLVCVEQPRYRAAERFPVMRTMPVFFSGVEEPRLVADVSASGFLIFGAAPGPLGMPIDVEFHGKRYSGNIIRIMGTEFGVEVCKDPDVRMSLMRQIYSEGYGQSSHASPIHEVGSAIVSRVFR